MENNNSNTNKWIWGIVAVIVALGLAFIANKNNPPALPGDSTANQPTQTTAANDTGPAVSETAAPASVPTTVVATPTKATPPAKKPAGNIITYTNNGFVPSVLTVKQGESVEFLNLSDKAMVIRSHDENPSNFYPGFSQEGGPLGKGGKFFFAFTLPGTWLYYNLNGNKEQGAIIVQ